MFVMVISVIFFLVALSIIAMAATRVWKSIKKMDIKAKVNGINELYDEEKIVRKVNLAKVKKARENVEAFKSI